ncbi:MAG: hypothetical protein U5L96_03440 [Owenweeksia sp.]|nr:hypothetical protein [Owenweeksia sp.]
MTRVTSEIRDSLLVKGSFEKTLKNVEDYRTSSFLTYRAQQIFESTGSPYSHQTITGVGVERIGSSRSR